MNNGGHKNKRRGDVEIKLVEHFLEDEKTTLGELIVQSIISESADLN